MTAIDAAIVELEAHREHTCQVIATLRRFRQIVEDAHELPVVHTVQSDAPTQDSPPTPSGSVLKALQASALPLRVIDICARTALPREIVRDALQRGVMEGVFRASGKTSARVYALARPRPGSVAGTQAAPPVGPTLATASKAASITDHGFETVWDGARERNGQAPSILPPREQKR
jgi:hypothetical protein